MRQQPMKTDKQTPTVAEIRKELADLYRQSRKLRAELRNRPSADERIALAYRDEWKAFGQPFDIRAESGTTNP
jgi:hypothetical protein